MDRTQSTFAIVIAGCACLVTCATPVPRTEPAGARFGAPTPPPPGAEASRGQSRRAAAATPGKVRCEAELCDLASEVCCISRKYEGATLGAAVGRCVPRPPADAPAGRVCCDNEWDCADPTIDRTCDEAADCPGEQRCCAGDPGEGTVAFHACGGNCAEEVCVAGSTCRNGRRCEAEPGASTGLCPLQIAAPSCDGVRCRDGEACCWDPAARRGRCARECPAEGVIALRCTSPAECAPYPCNGYATRELHCGGNVVVPSVLCETVGDCPKQLGFNGLGPGAPVVTRCAPADGLPAGLKVCEYE